MQATPQDNTTPTLFLAFELGSSKWKLAFGTSPRAPRIRDVLARNVSAVLEEIERAKARFDLPEDARVISCYEAGRDGFWLHRWLDSAGIQNVVIEPASILVNRRARRTKTDRLDVKRLLTQLIAFRSSDPDALRVVRVPDPEDEDLRRVTRERKRIVKEITQHSNRIGSLLNLHGVRLPSARLRAFDAAFEGLAIPSLGQMSRAEIERELQRLRLAQEQLGELNALIKRLLRRETSNRIVQVARQLEELKGIGAVGALTLSAEFFGWREFKNRRQVGSLAGLTDSHWKSDGIDRQQGISKAGNPRIRALTVELAWGWLRWQPNSRLTRWFYESTNGAKRKRLRRVAIVALARKLLVALWHWVEHGVVPEGAVLRAVRSVGTADAPALAAS